jgi:hypothetical protein
MTQEALKLAEDYAHMRAIWYVESLYGTSASHTELREKVMLGAHQALKEALAQTQEPVALETLLKWDDDIDPIGEVVGFIEGSPYIMVKVHKGKQVSLDDDLYATPPQRNEQCNYPDCKCPTENPCLKKLAQPEQEPVAFWNFNSGFSHCMIDQLNEAAKKNPAPLYTTPPQRTEKKI